MDEQPRQGTSSIDGSGFARVLNQHGYPFQFGTLKAAHEAFENRLSPWILQVSEFPVEVRGRHTRIDYVLQLTGGYNYLVVECKRANPKIKRWCFAHAPYLKRNASGDYLLKETIVFDPRQSLLVSTDYQGYRLPENMKPFHVAVEMKTNEKGDEQGSPGKGAIEEAATQVNLGLNGLIEFFRLNRPPFAGTTKMTFIPMILTTAELFATDVDLASADIDSGEIDPARVALTPKEWLFYQYPVSPGLKHSNPPIGSVTSLPLELGKALDALYLRTLAIVQGKHIDKFLAWFGSYLE